MKRGNLLGLVALCFAISPAAYAGGESSGGGGADDYQVVPAFFRADENRPIRGCVEATPEFGDPARLRRMVNEAFAEWAAYIPAKRLDIVPSGPTIQTRLELAERCVGGENLTFYFGVQNELIRHYQSQFSRPFGFAQLVNAGDYTHPAQAFVWIAPSGFVDAKRGVPGWSAATNDALRGLVLHEVGHVFGNGHVDGTVMTEKIGKYLHNDTDPTQTARMVSLYGKIDARIELVPCMECRTSYAAADTFDPLLAPGNAASSDGYKTFRTLMGRDPVAPMALRYERLGSPQGSGKLTLMDALGTQVFAVTVEGEIAERKDSTTLFTGQGGVSFYSFGISYFGLVRTLQGEALRIAVNYNMDGKKVQILPLRGGFYPRPIFVSAD